MATKAPLGVLIGEGQRENELIDEIKGSYAKLRESLDARQNQLFDPVLLAMAQGFLSPTKTGSFGEVLGNVAATVGPAQEAQNKREQEMAAMRMELAQQELGQLQATRGLQTFQNMVGGKAPATLSGAAPAAPEYAGKPGEPAMPAVSGMPPKAAAAEAPAPSAAQKGGWKNLGPDDILRLRANPATAQYADALEKAINMERDRYQISMQGIVFDRATGQYIDLPIPGQKQEDFVTKYGTFAMTPYQYSQYQRAESAGKGQDFLEKLTGRKFGGKESPGMRTSAERAGATAESETRGRESVKADVARFEGWNKAAQNSYVLTAPLTTVSNVLSRPDANQIFGVFENPDFGSAVMKLIESGVAGQALAGGIREAYTNLGLKGELKADQLAALQALGAVNLEMRKITRSPGEGAMSDFESKLALAAGLSEKDTPMGMRKKIEFLRAKSRFDQSVGRLANRLKKTGMSAEDVLYSPEYQKMADEYASRLTQIVSPFMPEGASAPTRGSTPAAQKLRSQLGL